MCLSSVKHSTERWDQFCNTDSGNIPCNSFTRGWSKGMEHRGWLSLYHGPSVRSANEKPQSHDKRLLWALMLSSPQPAPSRDLAETVTHVELSQPAVAISTWFWSQPTKDTEISDSLWHMCDRHIDSPESIPEQTSARPVDQAGTAHQGSKAADNPQEKLLLEQNQVRLLLWRIHTQQCPNTKWTGCKDSSLLADAFPATPATRRKSKEDT